MLPSLPPCCRRFGAGLLLLLAGAARAQNALPPAAPTDVIVRLDGQEVPGRVLLITPSVLRYLPAPPAGAPIPTPPDTLQLPVAAVFLVRYANGTREVLTRPGPVAAAPQLGDGQLAALSGPERQRLGRADAARFYRGRNVFWGAAGATLYLGPLFGLGSTAGIAGHAVAPYNLRAPVPALLQDPDYSFGYRDQAHHIKRGKAWAGYGAGVGLQVVLIGVLFGVLTASLN